MQYCVMKNRDLFPMHEMDLNFSKIVIVYFSVDTFSDSEILTCTFDKPLILCPGKINSFSSIRYFCMYVNTEATHIVILSTYISCMYVNKEATKIVLFPLYISEYIPI